MSLAADRHEPLWISRRGACARITQGGSARPVPSCGVGLCEEGRVSEFPALLSRSDGIRTSVDIGLMGYDRGTNQDGPGRGVCTSGRDLSRLIGVDL